jgi:hypothetical protein
LALLSFVATSPATLPPDEDATFESLPFEAVIVLWLPLDALAAFALLSFVAATPATLPPDEDATFASLPFTAVTVA